MNLGFVMHAPMVAGLDPNLQGLLNECWVQWSSKLPRNVERLSYVDGKNKLKDLQVSIPPTLRDRLDVVMGWPEKAVSEPVNRTVLEAVVGADGDTDPLGLARVMFDNRFLTELPQGVRASASYSCAFVTTLPGDVASGEPESVITFNSAMYATGLWSRTKRALRAGFLVNELNALGSPTRVTLLVPGYAIFIYKGVGGTWFVDGTPRRTYNAGVSMEVLPWVPDLDRPFGRARVDRRVISLTDRAVRAGSRFDVHSEMFSAMKLILLGADENAFKDENGRTVPLWSWYMGRFNVLGRDEEGELPQLEKISAESPEPHIAGLRQLASEFSGHTGVPLGSLGVAQANPESADAKNVAREDIVFMVEAQQRVFSDAIIRTLGNAVTIRERDERLPDELFSLELLWRRPDRASSAAVADAGAKQVAGVLGLAETEVGMEMVGMRPDQIRRATTQLRAARSKELLGRVLDAPSGSAQTQAPEDDGGLKQAQVLKAKADALGVLRRAGVDADDAARIVELEGVKFIPGNPITIKTADE